MAALCVFLAAACSYDYKYRRIPNYLIVLTAAVGGVRGFYGGAFPETMFYFGEAVLIMALFYPFFKIGALGGGDVKLLGVTAGYLPFDKILYFLFFSLLIAAIFSLLKMWKGKSFQERMRYLREYLKETVQSGCWKLYPRREEGTGTICLAGPVLVGILLYLGGVY